MSYIAEKMITGTSTSTKAESHSSQVLRGNQKRQENTQQETLKTTYENISNYMQNIRRNTNMNTKYQAAAACARPLAWAGPAAAWRSVFIL